jgi:hypothetical protein
MPLGLTAHPGPADGVAGLSCPAKEKFELAVVLGKIPKIQGLKSSNGREMIVGSRGAAHGNITDPTTIAVFNNDAGIIAR